MVRKLALEQSTAAMYARVAAEKTEQAKRFKERLTNDCNTLLSEIKEMLMKKESFDSLISNKDNRALEDFRRDLMNVKYYLK